VSDYNCGIMALLNTLGREEASKYIKYISDDPRLLEKVSVEALALPPETVIHLRSVTELTELYGGIFPDDIRAKQKQNELVYSAAPSPPDSAHPAALSKKERRDKERMLAQQRLTEAEKARRTFAMASNNAPFPR